MLPPLPEEVEVQQDLGRVLGPNGLPVGTVAHLVLATDGSRWVAKGKPFASTRPYEAANELIAWRLAKALGLPVLEAGLLRYDGHLSFGSREMQAGTFEHRLTQQRLLQCSNPAVLPSVVVFDVWLANVDRNVDNLLPRKAHGTSSAWELVLLDHGSTLVHPLLNIEELSAKAEAPAKLYGMGALHALYGKRADMERAICRVQDMNANDVERCVREVPTELLSHEDKAVVSRFLVERRRLLSLNPPRVRGLGPWFCPVME
ncbi:MAG: hypothetical protein QOH12_2516 [Solirubrobacteraceae bacterium]|nr:hypothetical protein [Solirubrobacteraceae bacterium]